MNFQIASNTEKKNIIYIIDSATELSLINTLDAKEMTFCKTAIEADEKVIWLNRLDYYEVIFCIQKKATDWQTNDTIRKAGAQIATTGNKHKVAEMCIHSLSMHKDAAYYLAEGMALSAYRFVKYRKDAEKALSTLQTICFEAQSITTSEVNRLEVMTQAIFKARTLVNEPLNYLSADQLAVEIANLGKEAGFSVKTLGKAEIEQEKMGGILAVNRGSQQPPTFNIMEYKPKNALNEKPIVLIGKGVVYDTGGLSLKPTPASMDRMKSDMSGAALVSCSMYAIARLKMPLHVIALVPATDNRPGENAYVPGDIITMYSGTTVEVLNTDAEGRLILADALHWAKRYEPALVVDFATLTGAASVAVGEHGIVCMGTAADAVKEAFQASGFRQYERLVSYPLWEEYGEMIKSDFADLKNIGGPSGGAITAGKFLEHFTDYPWMHFDIAGVSFATSQKGYLPSGGTGYGLRMLLDFLTHYSQ
ncbi:MAG: leucyl aminopeptidase [Bacteroidetes bacterium]|nr:leucyl aminopeptidase [Bacteroidota bacterium]